MEKTINHGEAKAKSAERKGWSAQSAFVLLYVIAALVALGALAFAVHTNPFIPLDLTIGRAVQSIHAQWFDLLMRGLSDTGYPPQVFFIVAWIFVVLYAAGLRWEAMGHAFATIAIGIVGLVLKYPIDRPRPDPHLLNVWNPNLEGGRMSFPAGHTESFLAIFGFLIFLLIVLGKPNWLRTFEIAFFAFFIVAVGVSRVYSGEHWFTDVIAGYLAGSVTLIATIKFYEWGKARHYLEPHKRE